jgi:GR25 family glycosyltransferase involved in LPS biosynthesis
MSLPITKIIYISHKELKHIEIYSKRWEFLNPTWKVKLYNDELCEKFLLNEYSQLHLDIFKFLKDGSIKCDFWRLCVLYKYGGLYVDADILPLVPLDKYIEDDDHFVTCIIKHRFYNPHFIMAQKEDTDIKNIIDQYINYYTSNVEYSYNNYSIVTFFSNFFNYDFDKEGVYFLNNKKYKFLKNVYEDINGKELNIDYDNICDGIINEHSLYNNIRVFNNRASSYSYDNHNFKNTEFSFKNFLINLERRPDRLYNFNNKTPIKEYSLIYGFDGLNTENITDRETIEKLAKFNNLRKGEIGCFMSHIHIFEKIVEENIDNALIMEDDCIFCDNFYQIFEKVYKYSFLYDILYLGGRFLPNYVMKSNNFIQCNDNIVQHNYKKDYIFNNNNLNGEDLDFRFDTDRTTSCYIISKSAAKKLLDVFNKSELIVIPIDFWIIETLHYNDSKIFSHNPLLCHTNYFGDSDIR